MIWYAILTNILFLRVSGNLPDVSQEQPKNHKGGTINADNDCPDHYDIYRSSVSVELAPRFYAAIFLQT